MDKRIRKRVYERDKATCQVCGRKLNWNIYECGHIVDRVVGGSDELTNLAAMCLICNRLKPIHRAQEEFIKWCELDTDEMLTNPLRKGIKIAQRNLAENGYMTGGQPPVGYSAESKQNGTVLVPDPAKFSLAQKAWEMRARGATYLEIHAACPDFYEQSRCWSDFFRNKAYLGVCKCGDIETPNAHPAACTLKQWNAVQVMRKKRGRGGSYPRRISSPYLLSGLLKCAHCGELMSGSSGGGWRYYICSRKAREGWHTCESRSVGADKVDRAIADTILDIGLIDSGQMRDNLLTLNQDGIQSLRRFLSSLIDRIVINRQGGRIYFHPDCDIHIREVAF